MTIRYSLKNPRHGLVMCGNGAGDGRTTSRSMYTFRSAALQDPDGVRSWLPCLDSFGCRSIFDTSVNIPNDLMAVCSGSLISKTPVAQQGDASGLQETTWRFVTRGRILAASLGVYVGSAILFQMPLYRCLGQVWATGSLANPKVEADKVALERRLKHTLLGFDLACRQVHKSVGRKYQRDRYTIVFVEGLGPPYSASFDGLSLVRIRNA